jgi:hypothetical protein
MNVSHGDGSVFSPVGPAAVTDFFFFAFPWFSNFRLQLPAFIVLKIVKDLKRYSTIVIELSCLASNAEMYRKMAPKFSVQKYLQHK